MEVSRYVKVSVSYLHTFGYFLVLFCGNHLIFWGIEQLHYHWCTGSGLYGFFTSMLTNQSGVCAALRHVSNMASSSGSQVVYAIIAAIGTKLYRVPDEKQKCV